MSDQPLIQLTDAVIGHGTMRVLNNVTWSICRGQAWYVVGRNGAGKSTLLATALGRLAPLAGQVQRRAGLVVGSVPQQCGLVTELPVTIAEFVAAVLVHVPRALRSSRVAATLATCGLTAVAGRQVWQVSGGERRRAMIARALVLQPDVVALDEPNMGLDAASERDLWQLIRHLHVHGVTVLCITHDQYLAATQATHVALVAEGTLRVLPPTALDQCAPHDRAWPAQVTP